LQPLAAQFLISASEEGSIESGLFYAVFCAEDMPWLKEETGTESYYTDPVPLMKAACAAYPANPVEKSAYPKGLQTPTLIVSGGADPVTPPANGAEVAALLTNSRHIILPGMGHGNLTSGCITDLAAQFIDEGGLEKLDLACAGRIKPPPFFLSPLGPQP